jgi:hypothetical protein
LESENKSGLRQSFTADAEAVGMPVERIFPTVMIGLDLCAAVVYLYKRDIWGCVYWVAAAVLTVSVTFRR